MALTTAQKDYILQLDKAAAQILQQGGEEALLMSLAEHMVNVEDINIKDILDSASEGELNAYCEKYDGFYQYMHLLERLAAATADGFFDDIVKK